MQQHHLTTSITSKQCEWLARSGKESQRDGRKCFSPQRFAPWPTRSEKGSVHVMQLPDGSGAAVYREILHAGQKGFKETA